MLIPPSPSRPPSHVSKRFRQLAFSGSQGSSKCNLPSDNEQDVGSKTHSGRHVSTFRSRSPRRPHSVEFGRHVSTPVSTKDRSRSPRRSHSVEFGRHMSRRPCSVESGRHALSAPVTTRNESRSPRRPQSSGPLFEILSEVKKTNTRLENFENRLQKLEESMQAPAISGPSTKRTVPTRVRVCWIKWCKATYYSYLGNTTMFSFLFYSGVA